MLTSIGYDRPIESENDKMEYFHEVTVKLKLQSSSPRSTEEIAKLVLDYLTNELDGVYLLTEDEVDEVKFEHISTEEKRP